MSRIVIIFISLFLSTTMCVITTGFAQTNWEKYSGNPVLSEGPPGAWDENGVIAQGMLFDSATYHMWYTGLDVNWKSHLGYATSSDAVTWTKYVSNPVLDAGAQGTWDQSGPGSPSIVFDSTTHHMWYDATDNSNNIRIGYATSPDRVTWTKYGANPVLDIGSPGEWDDEGVFNPMVIFDSTTYHMWYGGWDSLNVRIGYATSPDGITWTKYGGNPILDLGSSASWDDAAISQPYVIFDGTTYHMWYGGGDSINVGTPFSNGGSTGYATSPDGINWAKFANNPVLTVGTSGSWDAYSASIPDVIYDGSTYHMWYSGLNDNLFPWRIGYAVDSTTTTPVRELKGDIPTAFSLEQNYPNPFNPTTTIEYDLPKDAKVVLNIYNVLGQEVRTLINIKQQPGYKRVVWDGKDDFGKTVSSGILIYRLQAGDFIQIKKMLFLK